MPHTDRAQLVNMKAKQAVHSMGWTRDNQEAGIIAREVAHVYATHFEERLQQGVDPGLVRWLQALTAAGVPRAVVCNLDRCVHLAGPRASLDRFLNMARLDCFAMSPTSALRCSVLDRPQMPYNVPQANLTPMRRPALADALQNLGLSHCFQVAVTAEDGMLERSQEFLSAAIKLERPPNKCVAFVADEQGIAAAHNATVKAVAVPGVYPAYELKTADLTTCGLGNLAVYNLRRLFANDGHQRMELQQQRVKRTPPNRKKPVITAEVGQ
jgi:hypothetical protein